MGKRKWRSTASNVCGGEISFSRSGVCQVVMPDAVRDDTLVLQMVHPRINSRLFG